MKKSSCARPVVFPTSLSRSPITFVLGLLLTLLGLSQAASAQAPTLTLQFLGNELAVSGVTRGGTVVFFGVTQDIAEDEVATIRRRSAVRTDDDSDGVASFDLGAPIAYRSIWIAVDLASGAYVLSTPSGYPLQQVDFAGAGLVQSPEPGVSDSISDLRTFLEILVVRPGVAAWAQTVADGGSQDSDGKADGVIEAEFEGLPQIEGAGPSTPAPVRFAAGDLIFSIDPIAMEIVAVGASSLAGGRS